MPFPIQRIQTDRDRDHEIFDKKVQKKLMQLGIKFYPNKPASPLNGKVERSQKTDKTEFYATVDLNANDLDNLIS